MDDAKQRIKIVYDQLVRWRDQTQSMIDSQASLYNGALVEKRDVYDWLSKQLEPLINPLTKPLLTGETNGK